MNRQQWTPASRRSDPWTSASAETAITRDGTRLTNARRVLAVVQARPGLTTGEIGEFIGMDGHWKRLSDLSRQGLIYQGPARTWRGSGRKQSTWWPAVEFVQGKML